MHLLETINDSRRADSPKLTMFAKLNFHLLVSLLCLCVSPGLITHFLVTLWKWACFFFCPTYSSSFLSNSKSVEDDHRVHTASSSQCCCRGGSCKMSGFPEKCLASIHPHCKGVWMDYTLVHGQACYTSTFPVKRDHIMVFNRWSNCSVSMRGYLLWSGVSLRPKAIHLSYLQP